MTRVCLLGSTDVELRPTLLSHETARHALRTYTLSEPFHNAIGLETMSLGAAVALLNDLNWYLVRYTDAVLVREPSVSETEWLSRDLATAIRDDRIAPDDADQYLKVYGVVPVEERASGATTTDSDRKSGDGVRGHQGSTATPEDALESTDASDGRRSPARLVEPMYVTRAGGSIPEYDLRDVEETVVVRVTESEFGT